MLTKHVLVQIIEEAENEEAVVEVAPGRIYSNKINPSQKVFDITGRVVETERIQPGIYFIEVDGVVTQKVVKVR